MGCVQIYAFILDALHEGELKASEVVSSNLSQSWQTLEMPWLQSSSSTKHLRSLTTARSSLCSARRKLHESAYEKEVEDEVDVNVEVPPVEEMLHQPAEEYWEPDPDTGVFVPASEQNSEEPAVSCSTEETVLDEKAFFRPLEDLEAPPPESFTGEIPPVDPFAE